MSLTQNIARAKTDYDEVYEAGKQAQYDEFWDMYQANGNRTEYSTAFVGNGFNFDNFYPKYDIKPVGNAERMFYAWENKSLPNQTNQKGSLKARLEECGVVLDTSKVTYFSHMFNYGRFTELPTIDMTSARDTSGVFSNSWGALEYIEKVIVIETTPFSNCFNYSLGIIQVIFEGTIGQNGLNLSWSTKLNKASITSIINCLSTTTSGLSVTLSLTAVKTAFNTTDPSTCTEWQTLIGTRANWTINLKDS